MIRKPEPDSGILGKERKVNGMRSVLLVNGSPHGNGNTKAALTIAEEVFKGRDLAVDHFEIGNKPVRGCLGCGQCASTHRCAFNDDPCNELIEKMLKCDAVIIGTPVYFAGPNGTLCALLDRVFYAAANFGQLFAGKKAAAIATCWRAGATPSIDRINKYFTYSQMPVVSSKYWNGYLGTHDRFGASVIHTLACNMADMLAETADA